LFAAVGPIPPVSATEHLEWKKRFPQEPEKTALGAALGEKEQRI
jgi:hypothetical protein